MTQARKKRDGVLWMTVERSNFFLVPEARSLAPGSTLIISLNGDEASVELDSLANLEISTEEAVAEMRAELWETLDDVRGAADAGLAQLRQLVGAARHAPTSDASPLTGDAAPALWSLVKSIPSVIGGSLSGDVSRVASANATMAALQRRLAAAGIDVDARFADFPDRLAKLRADFDARKAASKAPGDR